jgi:hypothetical protein
MPQASLVRTGKLRNAISFQGKAGNSPEERTGRVEERHQFPRYSQKQPRNITSFQDKARNSPGMPPASLLSPGPAQDATIVLGKARNIPGMPLVSGVK